MMYGAMGINAIPEQNKFLNYLIITKLPTW
jgi:hypothetical protein